MHSKAIFFLSTRVSIGDSAFFYDMRVYSAIGAGHVARIMLIYIAFYA